MTLRLTHEVLRLDLCDPFRIARSDHDAGQQVTTLVVEMTDDRFPGLVGHGEGYPDRFYGDSIETMVAVFPRLLDAVEGFDPSADGLHAAVDRMHASIYWNGGAKCAID